MKRKIIRQGNNTLTITLPRGWVVKNNIKGGDEIEVNEIGRELRVSPSQDSHSHVEIDISGLDHNSIRQKIRSTYKKGFDEITIRFSNDKVIELRTGKSFLTIDVINEEVNLLLGFQITHQAKGICIIKDFALGSTGDFDGALRRVFLLLIEYGNDFLRSVKEMDRTSLAGMRDRHFNIGKFIFYCLRLINKGLKNTPGDTSFIYYIVTTLDDIVDIIKYAGAEILSHQNKLSKEIFTIISIIIEQNRNFYSYFYKPTNIKIRELAEVRWKVKKAISELKSSTPAFEVRLVAMMEPILELYYHLAEPRMALEYEDKGNNGNSIE